MRRVADLLRSKIQRACDCGETGCRACAGVQRAPRGAAPRRVPESVYRVLRTAGQPLDDMTRRQHARALEHDLGAVRVHHDADAARAARDLQAHAFTFGQHVVLAGDAPHERGPDGRALMRHELTHAVVQQERWEPRWHGLGALDLQSTDSADERDAQASGRVDRARPGPATQRDDDTDALVSGGDVDTEARPDDDTERLDRDTAPPDPSVAALIGASDDAQRAESADAAGAQRPLEVGP